MAKAVVRVDGSEALMPPHQVGPQVGHSLGNATRGVPPVLGFMLVGGTLVGAQVRDIRLANELARRGHRVVAWWAFDRPNESVLHPSIEQRWLFSWSRYLGRRCPGLKDTLGTASFRFTPQRVRGWIAQRTPGFMELQLQSILKVVCRGVETDPHLITRFASQLAAAGVTHLLPNLEMLAPFANAACRQLPRPPKVLVTFQGYEIYANSARSLGLEGVLYGRLRQAVEETPYPAITVSEAYSQRVTREVGLAPDQLAVIPPGVPVERPLELAEAWRLVASQFPGLKPQLPIVTYLGRRDSEKGIDLLLYAGRLLQHRGLPVQLLAVGPTAFGETYIRACDQVARHLRIDLHTAGFVSDQLRSALFRVSRAVVYPSIHEEPFGMVPVEAMAQGTPVVVPDQGGIASVVESEGSVGGLRFACWDSGDLAGQLARLRDPSPLWQQLHQGALQVARSFSVQRMGERVLTHLGLPAHPDQSAESPSVSPNPQSARSRAA